MNRRNPESGLYASKHFLSINEDLCRLSLCEVEGNMKCKGWIVFSGILWALLGMWLLYKGICLIAASAFGPDLNHSWASRLFGKAERGAEIAVGISVLIGFCKGRFILSKTARRVCHRILSLTPPIQLHQVYSLSYAFLILGMMGLGVTLKFLPIPTDVRGMIDAAVGAALVTGSMFYFRAAAVAHHTIYQK